MKTLIVILVASVFARTALAQAPGETNLSAPAPVQTDWYGWQLLLADGGVLTTAIVARNGDIALGWVATGALVHASHHHYGLAATSVALRVGLPLIGLFAGADSARGCTGDLCGLGPALVGGMVGIGTAEVVDLVLAKDERPVTVRAPRWQPVASVRHSGATFGIAATF